MSAADRLAAAEGMLMLGKCDSLVSDPDLEKVLTAELTAMFGKTGGRRKRMRGGIRIFQAVKSLMAALCATGKMVFTEITDYPMLRMKEMEDKLKRLGTAEGKADKDALVAKVKTLLKSGAGGIALADLSSPSSRLVKLSIGILQALNEIYPNALYAFERIPALATNLATIGSAASPIISTAIVTAASAWALRIAYRRIFKPAGEKAAAAAVDVANFLTDDEKIDEAIDAVVDQIPRLAEMALEAGGGAVRAAGTVWAGRLRNRAGRFLDQAVGEAAAVAGAIAALGAPEAAVAAMEAAGEAHEDAVMEAEQMAPPVGGRRRKTRKHVRKSKKRTLRRKY